MHTVFTQYGEDGCRNVERKRIRDAHRGAEKGRQSPLLSFRVDKLRIRNAAGTVRAWFVVLRYVSALLVLTSPAAVLAQPTRPVGGSPEVSARSGGDDPMLAPVGPAPLRVASWNEALDILRARSTDLAVARNDVLAAQAQTRGALAALLPSIGATGSVTHNLLANTGVEPVGVDLTQMPPLPIFSTYTVPARNELDASLVAVQPIFNLSNIEQLGRLKVQEEATRLSASDTRRLLTIGLAEALFAVVATDRIAELNRVGLQQALARLSLVRRRVDLGDATELDLGLAESDCQSARTTLIGGDEALRRAREALGLALGIPEEVGIDAGLHPDELEHDALRACEPVDALDRRSDVAAAALKVDAATRGVRVAGDQYAPTLVAQSTLTTTTADTGLAPHTTWNVQAVLSVPIWDGGARMATRAQARALEGQAIEKLTALKRAASVEIRRARRAIDVANAARDVAATAHAIAERVDRLTQASFAQGHATTLQLVLAASAVRSSELTLAMRELDLIRARVGAHTSLATCRW
jgi:outer membrane protein TolC